MRSARRQNPCAENSLKMHRVFCKQPWKQDWWHPYSPQESPRSRTGLFRFTGVFETLQAISPVSHLAAMQLPGACPPLRPLVWLQAATCASCSCPSKPQVSSAVLDLLHLLRRCTVPVILMDSWGSLAFLKGASCGKLCIETCLATGLLNAIWVENFCKG